MNKIDPQLHLLGKISEDWHLLCDQYQFKHKPEFEEGAGLSADKNIDQVQDGKSLFNFPEQLVKPIQRYYRLPKLLRWFWRWFWSIDDLYQPLIAYYATNKQLSWKMFSEQLFQKIQKIELFAEWVCKKSSATLVEPKTFADRSKNISDGQQQEQNPTMKPSLTKRFYTKEANKMKKANRWKKEHFNQEQFEFFQECKKQLNEILIRQDYNIEEMIENINRILGDYNKKLDALNQNLKKIVKNSEEKRNSNKNKLYSHVIQVSLDHLSQLAQAQIDRIKQEKGLSIEASLQNLADILEGWWRDANTLYNYVIRNVGDPRYYQNFYETHTQGIHLSVAQATGEFETLRRENWRGYELALNGKVERWHKNIKNALHENHGSPQKQWQVIEDYLKQGRQEIEELCAKYKQSGRAYEEKASSEYETVAQDIVEKLSSHAHHLQQSTGALTLYNPWYKLRAKDSTQLIMFLHHAQSTIKTWAVKRSQLLGRILDAKQRRVEIGFALIELEEKCQELRKKYHPDKYSGTLKKQVERINKEGIIEELEREASFWLMIGCQTYAKYAAKAQENELEIEKLSDEEEQKITDDLVEETVSILLIGVNTKLETMLRQNYENSAHLTTYLENVHHHYQQLEQLMSVAGKPHPSLRFWQEIIQWYEYSMRTWHHRMSYWEDLHFVHPCKDEDDIYRKGKGDENISRLQQQFQEEVFPALRNIIDQIEYCCDEKQQYSSPQEFPALKKLSELNRMYTQWCDADTAYSEIAKYPRDEANRISEESARLEYLAKWQKERSECLTTLCENKIQYMKAATLHLVEAAHVQSRYDPGSLDFDIADALNSKAEYEHQRSLNERLKQVQIKLEKQYQRFLENSNKAGKEDHWNPNWVLFIWLCRSQIQALRWGYIQWHRYEQKLIPHSPFPDNNWCELFEEILHGLEQWCQCYQVEADYWGEVVKLREETQEERQRYEKERECGIALRQELAKYKAEAEQNKLKTNGRGKHTQSASLWNFFVPRRIIGSKESECQTHPHPCTGLS